MLIVIGWWRGTRPEERRLALGTGIVAGLAAIAAVLVAEDTQTELAKGCAYALMVTSTASLAMLVRRRPGDDGFDARPPALDPSPHGDDDLPPFDWDDFERDFWREVGRRRDKVPS